MSSVSNIEYNAGSVTVLKPFWRMLYQQVPTEKKLVELQTSPGAYDIANSQSGGDDASESSSKKVKLPYLGAMPVVNDSPAQT